MSETARLRGDRLWLWCPGCEDLHCVTVSGPGLVQWQWDGDLERPTISPSILVHEVRKQDGTVYIPQCHSFVRAGVWEFLPDCDHALAGQHVPMSDIGPQWPWAEADE